MFTKQFMLTCLMSVAMFFTNHAMCAEKLTTQSNPSQKSGYVNLMLEDSVEWKKDSSLSLDDCEVVFVPVDVKQNNELPNKIISIIVQKTEPDQLPPIDYIFNTTKMLASSDVGSSKKGMGKYKVVEKNDHSFVLYWQSQDRENKKIINQEVRRFALKNGYFYVISFHSHSPSHEIGDIAHIIDAIKNATLY